MKKAMLIGAPLLVLVLALPLLTTLMVTMSTRSSADCDSHRDSTDVLADPRQIGAIDGPVGGPVTGTIGVASANIPNRSGLDGFRASMPKVLSTNPDFVTLNEVSARSLTQIEAAAPGYSAYRNQRRPPGPGGEQAMGNLVLWRNDTWRKRNAGRVKIVEDDQAIYRGQPVTWDRFATWALLERRRDGAVVSIVSVHHMTNPHKFPRQHGNPPLTRKQQYGQGMDILLGLVDSLAAHGPVFIGGDMNTHASYANLPWSAAAKMRAAGYGWYDHGVDFVFFPRLLGARLAGQWSGSMASDHHWIATRVEMNGAGPVLVGTPESAATGPAGRVAATSARPARTGDRALFAGDDVQARLTRIRFSEDHPTLSVEQARNAVTIGRVGRELGVPRFGVEIAIAVAIQESMLVNLSGGDRDSRGLFQQRPSAGWGTREQITRPRLAALAFFGRAPHTSNPGLLDIPGWQTMALSAAAQRVQRSAHPDAYARWASVARQVVDVLGGQPPPDDATDTGQTCPPVDNGGDCPPTQSPAEQGLTADALLVLRSVDARFGSHVYLGVGDRPTNPDSDHPSGRAVDVMIDRLAKHRAGSRRAPVSPTGYARTPATSASPTSSGAPGSGHPGTPSGGPTPTPREPATRPCST